MIAIAWYCISFLHSQCTINSPTYDFCANCVGANGIVTGDITLTAASFTIPSSCSGQTVSMGGIEIDVSGNALEIPGAVLITSPLSFKSSNGGAITIAGSTTFSHNQSVNLIRDLPDLISNNCVFTCTFVNILATLSVELSHFSITSQTHSILLEWITASEYQNDYFTIEHSGDGKAFHPIGKLDGQGSATQSTRYEFIHQRPQNGNNYYRLNQVDWDGTSHFSRVLSAKATIAEYEITILPNPVFDKVTFLLSDSKRVNAIRLFNALGQEVKREAINLDYGTWEIDLSGMEKGIYFAQIDYPGKSIVKKITKN